MFLMYLDVARIFFALLLSISSIAVITVVFRNVFKQYYGFGITFFVSFIIVLHLIAIEKQDFTRKAYRLGQINAISGKIEYERVLQSDSTVIWERIDREDE